jgi:tripartite ATP-independent transporter DctP family solute receptor
MNRQIRRSIAVTFILVIGMLGCRADDDTIVMKVAHNGPIEHPYQIGFETFKEDLERETGGRVRVEIFENEQLGTEEEASLMVKLGALAASAASAGGGLAAFVPEAEIFNFPFIFRDLDHFYRVVDGPVGERVARLIEDELDVLVLGYWFSGERNTWNSERPIVVPEDLKGLKIRVMQTPILIETFDALGALATPMSFGELYSALEQGVVSGAETDHVDLYHERFYEVTEYVSYTRHLYLAVGLIFSRKLFDDLPPDIQQAVLKAGEASVLAEREAMARMTEEAHEELMALGIQFNEVDRDAFLERVQEVYEKNADRVGGMSMIEEVARQ